MLVTVITPTYNRANFLERTIESVLSQNYQFVEYIVLDDGSTDNTQEVIEKYKGRITYLRHDNIGETLTVNKGYALSKGDIVVIINSDDPFYCDAAISQAVDCFIKNPDAVAVYPDWVSIDENDKVISEVFLPDYDLSSMLLDFNVKLGPSMFLKRQALMQVGLRDVKLKYTGDLNLSFRLAAIGKLAHLKSLVGTHRVHNTMASKVHVGSTMANEVLGLALTALKSEKLPDICRKNKSRILHAAYLSASLYCGENNKLRMEYRLKAFFYSPSDFLKKLGLRMLSVLSPADKKF